MEQLILHLIGDYITQSAWMAENKSRRHLPAFLHALVYSLPFLLLTGWTGWAVIFSTHFVIDRYRLVRYLLWAKNVVGCPEFWRGILISLFIRSTVSDDQSGWKYYPAWTEAADTSYPEWDECQQTGYPESMPTWLATWLSIIADNTLHLTLNYLAIKFL